MCTVIIANHHYKEFPLVIAANRDEDYARPSSPVQVLAKEPHIIIGGKDKLKGGTWLGVNKESLFVILTNQGEKNPDKSSRGEVVLNALKCKTLDELLTFVEELDPSRYNGFNLVFGSQRAVFIAHSYLLHSMVIRELPAGITVISSNMKFAGEDPKAQYIHKTLNALIDTPWLEYYKQLKKILSTGGDLSIRIKPKKNSSGKISGYCTRSSTILAFSDNGLTRYKFHDRTAPKRIRKEGDPYIPRYKDYIDLWRDHTSFKDGADSQSEEAGEVETEEEIVLTKPKFKEALLRFKSSRSDDDEYYDDDDD
jgi:uncharacterized protein with NRDE domain